MDLDCCLNWSCWVSFLFLSRLRIQFFGRQRFALKTQVSIKIFMTNRNLPWKSSACKRVSGFCAKLRSCSPPGHGERRVQPIYFGHNPHVNPILVHSLQLHSFEKKQKFSFSSPTHPHIFWAGLFLFYLFDCLVSCMNTEGLEKSCGNPQAATAGCPGENNKHPGALQVLCHSPMPPIFTLLSFLSLPLTVHIDKYPKVEPLGGGVRNGIFFFSEHFLRKHKKTSTLLLFK